MFTDPLSEFGLRPVTLADRPAMDRFFRSLQSPLSDYTFSQLFTWRNSLRIAWNVIENHLCVFANGSGDLTLLLPPIGDTGSDRALARAAEIMDQYNAVHACREKSRVEYVSEELLARFDHGKLTVTPQGTDYLYDTARMIDLAGGDLASKRQAKNRFMRNYCNRSESYQIDRHVVPCRELLNSWKERQDTTHAADGTSSAIKRTKESLATQLTLEHAHELGLQGMVVYAKDNNSADAESIKAFTFGEPLGSDQSSIVIEKTDLECKGLAQFIFSEFCRTTWSDRPYVNAGDDWGLESLAWTKSSYRPVKLLKKFSMSPPARNAISLSPPHRQAENSNAAVPSLIIRDVRREDLPAISALEQGCFSAYNLSKRQLQYLAKILRREEDETLESIRNAIENSKADSRRDTAALHRIEAWRERLLDEGDAALAELLAAHPTADRQHLRQLARNAKDERLHHKPLHAYRDLFRALRELLDEATETGSQDSEIDEA